MTNPLIERSTAVNIRELTPELLNEYLQFFDQDAFTDNPHWSKCYCMFYHTNYDEWERRAAADNRAAKSEQIRSGRAHGLLAYVEGNVVGWCNATPRAELPSLDWDENYRTGDTEVVGSIVCFIVAPAYRRQGIAHQLLDAACDYFRRHGLQIAEAYARKDPPSAAQAYHGSLAMYLAAGFRPFRDLGDFVIVRKSLR